MPQAASKTLDTGDVQVPRRENFFSKREMVAFVRCFCLRDRAVSPLHLGHRLRELEEAADPCGSAPATFLGHWDAPSRVLVCRQNGHLPPPRMTSVPSILTALPSARFRRGGGWVSSRGAQSSRGA